MINYRRSWVHDARADGPGGSGATSPAEAGAAQDEAGERGPRGDRPQRGHQEASSLRCR